jgi:DNA-binding NarL/FixJ family response regulator
MESKTKRRRPLEEVEDDLMFLVAQGYTNREIAIRLGRTETAVKGLLQRTYLRLWLPNRVALAAYARAQRWQDHGRFRPAFPSSTRSIEP